MGQRDMALLETRNLSKHFGGLTAVEDLDLAIGDGELVGLIGPNGAGKTTVLNMLSGFLPQSSGNVVFRGKGITGLKPHVITLMGLVRTFQQTKLFSEMTVLENVLIGTQIHSRTRFLGELFNTQRSQHMQRNLQEKCLEILRLVRLIDLKDELAKNLPHGHRRLLGIAIALATDPVFMLLDEPVTGMNAVEATEAMNLISNMRERGLTILLIEHNMRAVMKFCDRIIVLNYGKKIAEGLPNEIKRNQDVIRAYLGEEQDNA